MSEIARSNRYHIGIFGRRNFGKSTLLNALTGQDVSIVSDIAGTTTDTVWKNIELPGIGAAVIADTAGFDDSGDLGSMRNERTKKTSQKVDMAILLVNGPADDSSYEREWLVTFEKAEIPVVVVLSKYDEVSDNESVMSWEKALQHKVIAVSAKDNYGIDSLLSEMSSLYKKDDDYDDITYSLVKKGDVVLLVMPQDAQAPKGRLIQPQVLTLRNLLDKHVLALCCTPEEMPLMLSKLNSPPDLVITDSQVFAQVKSMTPKESRLTSFSVLMARHKGDINTFLRGADSLKTLHPHAKVLIAEACSHVPQNEDIGRVKLPRMLRKRFGEELQIDIVSGNDFPEDLTAYDLIIHCGACMFTRKHVMARVAEAKAQKVPITNYGVAIAALTGILDDVTI